MRTDVKIGVATGLLLVIVLVAYQLIWNSNGDKTKDGNSPGEPIAAAPPERPGSGLLRFGTPPRPGSTAPVEPAPTITPRVEPPIAPIRVVPEPAPTITPRVEPPIVPIRVVPEPAPTITPRVEPPIPSIREVPVIPVLPPAPGAHEMPVTPGPGIAPVGPTVEETYEVQKGDSGFWAIAEKKYGDGKYYYLIAKANPNVSSNSLRPGQKLVIPAKPVGRTEPTSPITGSPTPGGMEISPSGQQIYVVQKGDSGFWGIAQKQYGDGKYYYLIAKANPNVSSNSLQPGDKLVLPDKPAATTPAAGGSTTAPATPGATPLTPGPGQEVYTITKEDTTGLWGIAKKKYGNGAYWKIIAQANPKVSASGLKVGQQLILPAPPPEARKAAAGETATRPKAPGAPAAKRTDIEDVGPTPRFR